MAGLALMTACASAGSGEDNQVRPDAPRPSVDARPVDAFVDLCPTMQTCQAAMTLGQISGDTGSQMLTAMGHQAAWFRVRVTEDSSAVGGRSLRALAKLTSPAAVDFDVFTYVNEGSDDVECSTKLGNTTTNGTVNEVKAEWGEGSISNGNSDSRWMSIEVRPVSGMCAPSQTWQLVVQGNW
jgi:hypothetical protein